MEKVLSGISIQIKRRIHKEKEAFKYLCEIKNVTGLQMKHRKDYLSISEALNSLSKIDLTTLMFIALNGDMTIYGLQEMGKKSKLPPKDITVSVFSLVKYGYVIAGGYFYSERYYVRKIDELSVMIESLRTLDKAVIEATGNFSDHWNNPLKDTTLWKCAQCLVSSDAIGLRALYKEEPEDMFPLVLNSFGEPFWETLYLVVGEEDITLLNEAILVNAYNSSYFRTNDTVGTLQKAFIRYTDANRISSTIRNEIMDMIHCYGFLYEGTPFIKANIPSGYYSLCVEGVKALYGRNTDEAIKLFSAAMKLRNPEHNIKNVFYETTLCFLLILAYKMSDKDENKKKIQQFLNKKIDSDPNYFSPAEFTAKYVETLETEKGKRYVENLHMDMNLFNVAAYQYKALFKHFFKMSLPEKDLELLEGRPVIAVISHELSYWDNSKAGQDFSHTFGGKPILGGLGGKEQWELQIEAVKGLISKVGKGSKEAKGEDKTTRLVYFLNDETIEVREQGMLKNGNWGKGKKVSFETFVAGNIDCADDTDKKVMLAAQNHTTNSYYYRRHLYLKDAIYSLIGCDRVFDERTNLPVTVLEDKLYISITKKKDNLVLESNVKKWDLDLGKRTFISISPDKRTYKVIQVGKDQTLLLSYLLGIGKFPLASEEALKQILPSLGEVIEIHSDLLEGGSSLEKREGSPTVILRIIPSSDGFLTCAFVRPLEGGTFTSVPGEGQKLIYDQIGRTRYQVSRSLKTEKEAYEDFCDFCFEELGLSPTGNGELDLFPEELLSILDNFAKDKRFALEWPEGHSMRIKGALGTSSFKMSLRSRESWFDVEGDVDIDGDSIPVATIMELLSKGTVGTNFIRLSEGEYLKISDSLRKQLQRLESLTVSSRGKSSISTFKVGQLAEILRSSGLDIKVDKTFNELVAKIEASSKLNFDVPKELNATLRDYQVDGFEWISRLDSWGGGACLADDMGLGKTVQAIAFMLMKKDKGASLVVSPASVILNWKREISRFAPSFNVTVLNTAPDRKKAIDEAGPSDIILSTYGLLVSESEAICAKEWNVVCLDEAHTIKNRDTKMSAAAMKLNSSSRLILTGTPVQNYLGELWNLFQFLNPGLLGSFEQFQTKFTGPIENGDKERSSQLKRIIQPFILRRTKAEVIDELPDKTDITRAVELSAEETLFYEALRQKAQESLASEDKVNVNALAQITMLREAACSASLIDKGWAGSQSKISALMEIVPEILSGGNSLLVFSQFTSFLNLCRAELDKAGIPYFYLEGATPIKKREEMVQEFQAGKKKLFLISLKAGGLGLNLTGANYVIHLDPWWNPAIEQQATDRAYRIGQKQNVTVYHLISQHTIEEKITRLHKFKKDMADAILEGTNVSHALTMEELRELVQ